MSEEAATHDIIGWDVGGAHLKAAKVRAGRVVVVAQVACPLWLGMEHLERALALARGLVGEAGRHVVTTTGELTDHFASRANGIEKIAALMARGLDGDVALYAGRAGLVATDRASGHVEDIASANWHASAALVAARMPEALFADMGSTTTDLIPVAGGQVCARGYTDATRLVEGELVYMGLVRTFLMAVCDRVPFRGRWIPLMNEYFAAMSDVYRVLGTLDEAADQQDTADHREKTPAASRARLARMLGCDASDASEAEWTGVAQWFAQMQARHIEDAARLVLSRRDLGDDAPIVGAGVGASVVAAVAARLGRRFIPFAALVDVDERFASLAGYAAPAAAVALIASNDKYFL